MDPLVKKAWDLYRHTKTFPLETIHTATIWLEEKHRKTLNEKIAMAIALHDLLLALRYHPSMESAVAQEYCGRAVRWQIKACQLSAVALSRKTMEDQ